MAVMAVIGSRGFENLEKVRQVVNTLYQGDIVVSGGARGTATSGAL